MGEKKKEKYKWVYQHEVIIESCLVRVICPEATQEEAEEKVGGKEVEVVSAANSWSVSTESRTEP